MAKEDTTSTNIHFGASFVMPLAKNVSYVGGIGFDSNSEKVKEPADSKSTTTTLAVNLATLRVTVD